MSILKQKVYYSNLINTSENEQHTLFKIVNVLLDKNKTRSYPDHENLQKLAEDFNEFYVQKLKKIRENIPKNNENNQTTVASFIGTPMESFHHTTVEELNEIIKENSIKTSSEDPIPSSILAEIIEEALPILTTLINKSFEECSMDGVKESVIDPLLKKAALDKNVKNNYRPSITYSSLVN